MGRKLKATRSSGNVFADLGFDKAEAENLRLRAELMMRIEDFYRRSGMTQSQAAEALGLTQPRLNALLKGRIGLFESVKVDDTIRKLINAGGDEAAIAGHAFRDATTLAAAARTLVLEGVTSAEEAVRVSRHEAALA